jgi:acyl-CoA synthetase
MLGYFDDQSATEGSFNCNGWFMSGDLGVMDQAGNVRIEGRLKDTIIRGGHNIYPTHIETLALRHSGVDAATCFPVRDDRLGERVCIAVIGDASADDVLCHLAAEGLSRYEMPEYFMRVSELPMTASGKVLKRELTERVQRGELVPQFVRFRAVVESDP